METTWRPDILGAGFEQRTLDLGADDEGPVHATLVGHAAPKPNLGGRIQQLISPLPLRDIDVLYVHGWSDYFFQTELAEFWTGLGARFYALDLRKYGRSLRDGQTPGYITDLATYDAEIQAARDVMATNPVGPRSSSIANAGATNATAKQVDSSRRLVLVGHSTGGLILALWAARHPGVASALILNSPWLEFQAGAIGRAALAPLVKVTANIDPRGAQPHVDLGLYTRAQAELGVLPTAGDPARWRPARGFVTRPAWLAAILAGHRRVNSGALDIGCPVLVLLSQRSTSPIGWDPAMTSTDSVLLVDDIARAATRIGPNVTIARIDDAIHDVFLSAAHPRRAAYHAVRRWMLAGALSGASR